MTFSIDFHPQVHEDFINAYIWYEERQTGLGERFLKEVDNCLLKITANPQLYAITKNSFREAHVKVFPYTIVYRIFKSDKVIYVTAIYHGKRKPENKFRRKK